MKKEIVICHKEQEYACRLASYLNQRSDEKYFVMATTCPNEIYEMLQRRTIDLLLLDEEYVEQQEGLQDLVEHCYLLVQRETQSREAIMMYVAADEIYHKIMRVLFQREKQVDREDFKLIAMFALGVLEEDKQGLERAVEKNYLYWDWNSFERPVEHSKSEDFIYDVKRRREDMTSWIEEYICRVDGCDTIPATRYYMDMRSITSEDMQWVTGKLHEIGYAGVLVNMCFSSLGNINLLKEFSKIYIKADAQWLDSHRYEQFMQYLDYLSLSREIVEVNNS